MEQYMWKECSANEAPLSQQPQILFVNVFRTWGNMAVPGVIPAASVVMRLFYDGVIVPILYSWDNMNEKTGIYVQLILFMT